MAAARLIPVSEYLATTYHPDREYVDGELVERNVGEFNHSRPQTRLAALFIVRETDWNIRVVVEQRIQGKPTRFRIPDVCVVLANTEVEQIYRRPPFLCVEILSKDDTMTQIQEKIDDYFQMGVAHVWVIDPRTRRGYQYTAEGMREAKDGVMRTSNPELAVPLSQVLEQGAISS